MHRRAGGFLAASVFMLLALAGPSVPARAEGPVGAEIAGRPEAVERADEVRGSLPSARELEARAVALKRVSEKLICQCGCSMILAECSHQSCPFALPARREIVASIDAGRSDSEIVAAYALEYGNGVLAIPPTEGSILRRFAWFAPFLALALGTVVVAVYLYRITRPRVSDGHERSGTGPSAEDRARQDRYRGQIEQDLASGARGPAGETR